MPAQLPVQATARIVVNGLLGSVPHVNVFHWQRAPGLLGAFSQPDVDLLAQQFRSIYASTFLTRMCNAFTLTDVTATDLSTDIGPVGVQGGTTAGTVVGTTLPANCALCVSWKTVRRYRGGHARSYFSGIANGEVSGANTWISTTVSNWIASANTFRTNVGSITLVGGGGGLVVVHRTHTVDGPDGTRIVVNHDPPITVSVSATAVDNRVDSQRRRLGRDRPA